MSKKIFYSEHFYEKGSKDTEALEKNVRDYPFSSVANFLLLYHYKKISHPDFGDQAKKTALLFSNPQWLEFQLNDFAESRWNGHAEEMKVTEDNNTAFDEPAISDLKKHPIEQEQTTNEHQFVSQIENESYIAISEFTSEATSQNNFIPEAASEETSDKEASQDQHEAQNAFIQEETSAAEDDILTFEPLHMIDYFASQGIQLSEDQIKNDKLVNQVKSFTAWLKTMKKLHPSKLEELAGTDEKLIQSSAEFSNLDTEVLTEAMAEVLIKQDKKEKAIEMYTKLSLINPAKSAYFASRIEQIKSTL